MNTAACASFQSSGLVLENFRFFLGLSPCESKRNALDYLPILFLNWYFKAMRMRSLFWLPLFLACLGSACTPGENPEPTVKPSVSASLPENIRFSGDIDGRLPITMKLRRVGQTLSGTYQYLRKGQDLQLQGDIRGSNIHLSEFDASGKQTGTFSGEIQNGEMIGTWKGNGRSLPFKLCLEKKTAPQGLAPTSAVEVSAPLVTKQEEIRKGNGYTAKMTYPQLSGMKNTVAQSRANLALKAIIKPLVDDFVRETEQNPPDEESAVSVYEMEISYDDIWISPQLISVQYGVYVYSGGAHGNHFSKTLTINLQTGNPVRLDELFKQGFLKPLSQLVREELRKDARLAANPNDEWFINGTAPNADNYKNVVMKSSGFLVKFDPYEIAAYAQGDFEVLIPY
ncbi:MAG TPA: hypothetical protein DIW24_02870, partial [Bacteroidetes bacterium]|nr:hypothetical protein [Bacteroidota bacterium]